MVVRCEHEGNCSASRGLPSDADQSSHVTEFSIRIEHALLILFLASTSFDNRICAYMRVILSIFRLSVYVFDQEMFGLALIMLFLTDNHKDFLPTVRLLR